MSYALSGLRIVFREEQSFRLQLLAAVFVLAAAAALGLTNLEKIILILVSSSVLVLELINSIFERVADLLKPRLHVYVETIKDIMAAAVLLASLAALVIGIIIFWPHLSSL